MEKRGIRIISIMLTVLIGISYINYPVYAQEEQTTENSTEIVNETNVDDTNLQSEEDEIVNTNNPTTIVEDESSQTNNVEETRTNEDETVENNNLNSTNNISTLESVELNNEVKLDDRQTQNVVNVTINGVTTGYTNINDAFAACNGQTATITLLDNVTSTAGIDVNNANITFVGGDFELYSKAIFLNFENSTFTLESGYINHDLVLSLTIKSNSKFIMNGGKVNWLDLYGICNLNGGEIENLSGVNGTIYVYGGSIGETNGNITFNYPSPAPTYNVVTTKDTIIVNLTNYDAKYGLVVRQINKVGEPPYGTQYSDKSRIEFTSLEPDQEYTISLYYQGKDNYMQSKITTFTVRTKRTITDEILNQIIIEPIKLSAVYSDKLSDVKLPEGWSWVNPNTVLDENDGLISEGVASLGEHEFIAQFDVSQYDDEYDFSEVEGYDDTNHVVKRNLKIIVGAKENKISLKENVALKKTYDGKPFSFTEYDIQKDFDVGTLSFVYEERKTNSLGDSYWHSLEQAPTKAGHYRVIISNVGAAWYSDYTIYPEFDIEKADTILEFTVDNLNKVYDGKTMIASTKQTGNSNVRVLSWYQFDDDGQLTKLQSAPVNAGKYKVVASVEADSNYNEVTIEKEFTISQATNEWVEELSINGWTQGDSANIPNAKAKFGDVVFTYSNKVDGTYSSTVPSGVGTWYVKAFVAGDDNYTSLEAYKEFKINAKAVDTSTSTSSTSGNNNTYYQEEVLEETKETTRISSSYKYTSKDNSAELEDDEVVLDNETINNEKETIDTSKEEPTTDDVTQDTNSIEQVEENKNITMPWLLPILLILLIICGIATGIYLKNRK